MNTQPQPQTQQPPEERRGVVLILTAILLVTMFGFVAFSVDYGYMSIVHGSLQNAADSAALASVVELGDGESQAVAVAGEMAAANPVGSHSPTLNTSRTQSGVYDRETKTFTPTTDGPNAMRVVTQVIDLPLFFAPVLGHDSFSGEAEAIAMTKPREIVLVVDLSSSMNNDTQPVYSPFRIRNNASSLGVANSNIGFELLEDLWQDFDFGDYPGQLEHIGEGSVRSDVYAYARLTLDDGPLRHLDNTEPHYDIDRNDPEWKRKRAAYRWIIDKQLARLMPNALPAPNSSNSASYAHYEKYLDYVISRRTWYNSWGRRRNKSWGGTTLPTDQHWWRLGNYWNPDTNTPYRDKVGYETYVEWLISCGRDRAPTNDYNVHNGARTQMSLESPLVRTHAEDVNGTTFDMPPRVYPMHACRRSLIRAIQVVQEKNQGVSQSVADRVSVVSFDALDQNRRPILRVPLTTDYDAAMLACSRLQVVGKNIRGGSTSAQVGLDLAAEQLVMRAEGGPSRNGSERVVIFLCDGAPNQKDISDSDIADYISDNPSDEYYSGSDYYANKMNAPLISAHKLRAKKALLFSVGMGMSMDYNYMDRMSRMAGTDRAGGNTRTSGDPEEYEESITAILEDIIRYAGVSLVR